MFGKETTPDRAILKDVNKRLSRSGTGRGMIAATVRGGQVTLTGRVQYESQRRALMQTVRRVDGMKGVTDQIKVKPRDAC